MSLGALLLNDFVLKPNYPGVVSGILSDLAGMIFFPVLFVALAEFLAMLTPRRPLATPRWFIASTALIAFLLVTVKFTELGQAFYRNLVSSVVTSPIGELTVGSAGVVADPWDLIALALAPIPIWIGFTYRGSRRAALARGGSPSSEEVT